MVDESCRHAYGSRCLVGVKTPSIFLPFFNCPSDIIVMFDFHTFILFQLNHHPFSCFDDRLSLFRFSYNLFAYQFRLVGLKFNPTNHKLRHLWVSTNSLNGQLQGFPLSLLGFFGIVCYLSPSPHSGHFGNNLVKSVSEN